MQERFWLVHRTSDVAHGELTRGFLMLLRSLMAVAASAFAIAYTPNIASAGEQPNILIMGEDADLDTVPRDSRIFNRVLRALSSELEVVGFRVYDETAVSMGITNPNRVRRDDAELITVAKRIQDVPIDAVTVFEIYASTERSPFADIVDLRLRVSGRMLNVTTGRSLGNYEVSYAPGELPPLPPSCDRSCLLEHVGDQASRIASDVGLVLAAKLDAMAPTASPTGLPSSLAAQDECVGMVGAYTLSFKHFDQDEITAIEEYLVAFKGYDHHRPVRVDGAQADYWYETCSDEARLNRNLRLMAEHMGVDARVAMRGNRFDIVKIRTPATR